MILNVCLSWRERWLDFVCRKVKVDYLKHLLLCFLLFVTSLKLESLLIL